MYDEACVGICIEAIIPTSNYNSKFKKYRKLTNPLAIIVPKKVKVQKSNWNNFKFRLGAGTMAKCL